jgi:hypothetical protein
VPAINDSGLGYVTATISTIKVRAVREGHPKPKRVSVEALARSLSNNVWHTITWRDGSNEKLRSRFARVRVRAAPIRGEARLAEETLLIKQPKVDAAPTKFWLPPSTTTCRCMISSISPSCAGESSAIIKSSSKKSARPL